MGKSRWQPPHPAKVIAPSRFERTPAPLVTGRPATTCQYRGCGRPRDPRIAMPLCQTCALNIWMYVGAAIAKEHGEARAKAHSNHVGARLDAVLPERRRQNIAALPRGQRPGYIYYLRFKDTIKVGWAADVAKRMRSYPPGSVLLAVHPGTLDDETELHARFTPYRVNGREWYTRAQPLVDHIAGVVKRHGLVDQTKYMPGRKTHGSRIRVVRG